MSDILPDFESLCLKLIKGQLWILDQTQIPHREEWVKVDSIPTMVKLIQSLAIRGAPAIGVGAALALAQFAKQNRRPKDILIAAKELHDARPTAVNLMWAMNKMALKVHDDELDPDLLQQKAMAILMEDVELCQNMAKVGQQFINDGDRILTHCNTGGLATAGIGTALGVIRMAHQLGKKIHVYADETRPLLQGGRLTAWECARFNIPYTVICDNMAAILMRDGKIDKVFLGSDRVAKNGDFANKVGTYGVSVLAKAHGVPFYPVAPYSTIDPHCPSGKDIPIEQRAHKEVLGVQFAGQECQWAPKNSQAFNPAFDVTPVDNISHFIFNHGAFSAAQLKRGEHLSLEHHTAL